MKGFLRLNLIKFARIPKNRSDSVSCKRAKSNNVCCYVRQKLTEPSFADNLHSKISRLVLPRSHLVLSGTTTPCPACDNIFKLTSNARTLVRLCQECQLKEKRCKPRARSDHLSGYTPVTIHYGANAQKHVCSTSSSSLVSLLCRVSSPSNHLSVCKGDTTLHLIRFWFSPLSIRTQFAACLNFSALGGFAKQIHPSTASALQLSPLPRSRIKPCGDWSSCLQINP